MGDDAAAHATSGQGLAGRPGQRRAVRATAIGLGLLALALGVRDATTGGGPDGTSPVERPGDRVSPTPLERPGSGPVPDRAPDEGPGDPP